MNNEVLVKFFIVNIYFVYAFPDFFNSLTIKLPFIPVIFVFISADDIAMIRFRINN